ncbi:MULTISPECIES: 2-hydroxychromene-2-carboxylate isomerase [Ramlibacter]|uniref:2-hydroxychromene-2-carboxylate isomerase n=1 Tax=Ramlibacter aquaticus TaxID=2780094 RepID=A0ABR9S9Z3_9BURK|nr:MULTISPECIES: 2-hydroxychromene-2-carboxylate isomerase [Ramlibacter]MBE7939165.1 2-hydroxychromene-2-carboxylate isomerase [Ramlibacter aquaticus]
MKTLTFHLDFISPYAHLAFEHLPQALQGISHAVDYRPVLFAAMLKHGGQLGPAEIPGKREWTYRQVLWLGHANGIDIQMPAAHPFNPLPLLRLALACGRDGLVNRHVAETVFRHVWHGGADAADPARLAALRARLAPARDPDGDEVKAELRANTEAAIAAGVFGVPALVADGRVFWGFDSLPMLRAALQGDPWFDTHWDGAASVVQGIRR